MDNDHICVLVIVLAAILFVLYTWCKCALHVWRISIEDLDSDDIAYFPIALDESSVAAAAQEECCICLDEFENGERVKVLPRCNHCYHPHCVNKWLTTHSTCPLCRASINCQSNDDLQIVLQ